MPESGGRRLIPHHISCAIGVRGSLGGETSEIQHGELGEDDTRWYYVGWQNVMRHKWGGEGIGPSAISTIGERSRSTPMDVVRSSIAPATSSLEEEPTTCICWNSNSWMLA